MSTLTTKNCLVILIDLQEKMMSAIHDADAVVCKCAILARGARVLGVPVLVTRQYPKGLGDTIDAIKEAAGAHEPTDKTAFSCLGEDNGFAEQLTKPNIIVAGVETHICVQQTVLDLMEQGFAVYLAADCCGSRSPVDRGYAVSRMGAAGAIVSTAESILFEMLKSADHPARKAVQSLVK